MGGRRELAGCLHIYATLTTTPDWSARNDLLAVGRCAPARANDAALEGIALWERADTHATEIRPDEPICAHAVASLPPAGDVAGWRAIIEGFCEDYLTSQGMAVDWAIHYREGDSGEPAIHPHVHMLITMRVFDRAHADLGRVRQNWLRTDKARKALAEKWWSRTGLYPRCHTGIA